MKALTIDGGGVFGLIPATQLRSRLIYKDFDAYGGTSIGSAIAAYYACGLDPSGLPDLMLKAFPDIFTAPWYRHCNACCSDYPSDGLVKFLDQIFGDRTMGAILRPLYIVSTDLQKKRPKVFSSMDPKDADVRVQDAVLASVSAPTYFPPFQFMEPKLQKLVSILVDGGLWANNPSVAVIASIMDDFKIDDMKQLSVMSLGTGFYTDNDIDASNAKNWSEYQWALPLIHCMLDLSVASNEYIASKYPLNAYMRWNKVPLEAGWLMDSTDILNDIIAQTLPYQGDFDQCYDQWKGIAR